MEQKICTYNELTLGRWIQLLSERTEQKHDKEGRGSVRKTKKERLKGRRKTA